MRFWVRLCTCHLVSEFVLVRSRAVDATEAFAGHHEVMMRDILLESSYVAATTNPRFPARHEMLSFSFAPMCYSQVQYRI